MYIWLVMKKARYMEQIKVKIECDTVDDVLDGVSNNKFIKVIDLSDNCEILINCKQILKIHFLDSIYNIYNFKEELLQAEIRIQSKCKELSDKLGDYSTDSDEKEFITTTVTDADIAAEKYTCDQFYMSKTIAYHIEQVNNILEAFLKSINKDDH